jgi:hypothetical protein
MELRASSWLTRTKARHGERGGGRFVATYSWIAVVLARAKAAGMRKAFLMQSGARHCHGCRA